MLADAGGAGEQQVIEGQLGKRHADFSLAKYHADQVLGKDPGQQLLEQQAGRRCRFAELEHHPVARRQRSRQRPDGQEQRVVPRHDDPDHAQRLVHHFGRCRLEGHAHLAPGGFHPTLEMSAGVMDPVQARHQLGQQCFVGAAVAEILADGVDQGLSFVAQYLAQCLEPLSALFGRWHRVGGVGLALGIEERLQLVQLLLRLVQVGNVGRHRRVPDIIRVDVF